MFDYFYYEIQYKGSQATKYSLKMPQIKVSQGDKQNRPNNKKLNE